MKHRAICVRCGEFKKNAFATCKACDLTPRTDFEAARALILSEKTLYGERYVGKTWEELEKISEAIRNGRPFAIDGEEQSEVVRIYYAYLKSLPKPRWYQQRKFIIALSVLLLVLICTAVIVYIV